MKNECDICYENKEVNKIMCCKGKKWCLRCEKKITDKCPFCRTVLLHSFNFINYRRRNRFGPIVFHLSRRGDFTNFRYFLDYF